MIAWNNAYLLVEYKLTWIFSGLQIWGKHAKIVREIIFFAIFLVWFISFSLKYV